MIPLKLSTVKPDFSSILLQLQLYLQATGSWVDLQTSGTGQTLLEMMAAVCTLNQFGIESAARETSLTTAARDSSVYAITRMLGVRIHRKSPARVSIQLTRQDASTNETIPPFTQFDINGVPFFNRHPLMFVQSAVQAAERLYYGNALEVIDNRTLKLDYTLVSALKLQTNDTFNILVNSGPEEGTIKPVVYLGETVGNSVFVVPASDTPFTNLTLQTRISLLTTTVSVQEGSVRVEDFTSDGTAFQQYYLDNKWFTVSDIDVEVRVMDEVSGAYTTWEKTDEGLWVSGQFDKVFYDSTSGLGEAIIAFGDGVNGASPKLGNRIKITYAVTTGATANTGMTNLTVGVASLNAVAGTTVSVISGGADEKPANYYRTMAPVIFKARNRGVTVADYKAVALDYPGIISASIRSQRDVAPTDLRWMNQIEICLLPSSNSVDSLTAADWDDFLLYMDRKKHAAVNIITRDPERQLCDIDLTLALKNQYVVSSVVPPVEQAVIALFKRQSDTLGRRITISDVIRSAMSVAGVDYCIVNKCVLAGLTTGVMDLLPADETHYLEIGELLINTKYTEREIY